MDKKLMFMYLLYTTLLIIMFSMVGLIIDAGDGDKKYAFTFLGISIALSLVCLFAIYRGDEKKSQTLRYVNVLSTLLMLGSLIGSIVISKPTTPQKIQIVSYSIITLVVLLNMWATWYFIGIDKSNTGSDES